MVTKSTSNWKPLPLTTVELQKQGSRLLGLSSSQILEIAERLYTKGFVSYPRTETNKFDSEINLLAIVEKQATDQTWGHYAASLLQGKFKNPRGGNRSDHAHPPIHPVNHVAAHALQKDEHKVYEYIVRRFLAYVVQRMP